MCLGPLGKWLLQGCEGRWCAARMRTVRWWECWKQDTGSCLGRSATSPLCHACAFLHSACPFPLQNGYSLFITLKINGVQNLVGISWFSSAVSQQGKLAQPKHHAAGVSLLPIFEPAHLQLICVHLCSMRQWSLCSVRAELVVPCIGCYQKLCVYVGGGGEK